MKKLKNILFLVLSAGIIASCGTDPEPINYGEDSCHFCDMTIVSQAHAAQAVSKKGKQFKYDAIECMLHDDIRNNTEMAVQRVSNYENPGTMLGVREASFVINDSINSPMGENLAAIEKNNPSFSGDAEELYSWEELRTMFVNQKSLTSKN